MRKSAPQSRTKSAPAKAPPAAAKAAAEGRDEENEEGRLKVILLAIFAVLVGFGAYLNLRPASALTEFRAEVSCKGGTGTTKVSIEASDRRGAEDAVAEAFPGCAVMRLALATREEPVLDLTPRRDAPAESTGRGSSRTARAGDEAGGETLDAGGSETGKSRRRKYWNPDESDDAGPAEDEAARGTDDGDFDEDRASTDGRGDDEDLARADDRGEDARDEERRVSDDRSDGDRGNEEFRDDSAISEEEMMEAVVPSVDTIPGAGG
ncbi:MAG: hypothetical protein R3D33_15880 [Hyphomicrobiaceae bacterium]